MMMRNIPIGVRLTLAFAMLVLIMFLLGGASLLNIHKMKQEEREISEQWLPAVEAIADLNLSLMHFRLFTLRTLIDSSPEALARSEARLVELEATVNNNQQRYKALISEADEQRLFDELITTKVAYFAGSQQLLGLVKAGQYEQAKARIESQLNPLADQMTRQLIELNLINDRGVKDATVQAEAAYEDTRETVIATLAVAVALTVFLAVVITRSITRPLATAVAATERVAGGDLSHQIEIFGRDEPARLLLALQQMQGNLRAAISHIADSAMQLASATEELHAVSEDASRNLQQQNSEIQQAASAVTEMSAAVDEVARNASSTAEASNLSSSLAHQGRDQVRQTVTAIQTMTAEFNKTSARIEGLAEESKDIGKVLEVIRAIAEQTNLLALNAAIEAARAGEAGRGFAVVADEVRALAHRTQVSTREIEQMIARVQTGTQAAVSAMRDSSGHADQSLTLAEAAGQALEKIYERVGQINERNLLIASASEEQAAVAREVDRNIVNISDLSQQSAAGANQTSASAQELARLATDLNSLVTRFVV